MRDSQNRPNQTSLILALALCLLLILLQGCTVDFSDKSMNSLFGQKLNATNNTSAYLGGGNQAPAAMLGANSSNNTTRQAQKNVCTTKPLRQCPDGSPSYKIECTSGYVREFICPTNPYNKDLKGVPGNLLYLAKFKCYWEQRETSGYGKLYDPFVVCRGQMAGWDKACECAETIETYVRKWGMPT
ncbi:hypothetical protein FJZ26_01620 [Candidatus Parvarchaeota archaeon]|nr:hypothetical protein [Candidatus Parvarchaeota archaeon]